MSLINDALKRARQAQDQASRLENSSPGFRTVDPPRRQEDRPLLPFLVGTGVFGLILFLGWQTMRTRVADTPEVQVSAKTIPAAQAAETAPQPEPVPEPVPPPVSAPEPVVVPAEIPKPVAPPPPLPRLQAIIFSPANPSAIIDGKTLFVGEQFGDMLLVAVTQNSATLVGNGRTNRLTIGR